MKLNLSDLYAVSEKLFLHLEKQGLEVIDIPVDYYWNIPREQLYNPYEDPSDLDLGQLTDNWSELQKILESENEPLAYYFVWLAAIMRAVGEHILT